MTFINFHGKLWRKEQKFFLLIVSYLFQKGIKNHLNTFNFKWSILLLNCILLFVEFNTHFMSYGHITSPPGKFLYYASKVHTYTLSIRACMSVYPCRTSSQTLWRQYEIGRFWLEIFKHSAIKTRAMWNYDILRNVDAKYFQTLSNTSDGLNKCEFANFKSERYFVIFAAFYSYVLGLF